MLVQAAGKNCRLRHNIDAVNDEFGEAYAMCEMWNRHPTASSCSLGLLIQCLLNDRVRRIGTVLSLEQSYLFAGLALLNSETLLTD